MSDPVMVQKYCLGFSYISLKDYELDHNFDDIPLKTNWTPHPTIKLIFSRNYCVH